MVALFVSFWRSINSTLTILRQISDKRKNSQRSTKVAASVLFFNEGIRCQPILADFYRLANNKKSHRLVTYGFDIVAV